ncbi:MAG: hypothetical protein ACRD4G_00255 [Bryobacteraceae bacterium]
MRFSTTALVIGLLALSGSAIGRPVSFGIVAGASLTQDFQKRYFPPQPPLFPGGPPSPALVDYSTPKRFIVGGMLEVGLPLHFSVEADALYHELEYTSAAILDPNETLNSVSPSPVVTWEFPVMAKYHFSQSRLKPFLEAGPVFRSSGNLNGTNPSTHGFTVGGGVAIHAWKLTIAPEVRYLRWARDHSAAGPPTVQNQVEVLLGFSL